ncbi:uncharacterized protein [Apostichopus japonicus]|uniref:uncharacterized protein n=1 Tax=Stichopus japonicus TaxID=307972 RepID=UPI003AB6D4B4
MKKYIAINMNIIQYMQILAAVFVVMISITSAFVVKQTTETTRTTTGSIPSNHVMAESVSTSTELKYDTIEGKSPFLSISGAYQEGYDGRLVDQLLLANSVPGKQGERFNEDNQKVLYEGLELVDEAPSILEEYRDMKKRSTTCQNPTDRDLEKQLLIAKIFETMDVAVTWEGSKYDVNADSYVPMNPTTNMALNRRTACPWMYDSDENEDRYPRIIAYAKCKCTKCVHHEVHNCRQLTVDKVVLMKDGTCDEENYFKYTVAQIKIPVACACSRTSFS